MKIYPLLALVAVLLGCMSPPSSPSSPEALGVAAQPLKDTQGWVHVAYGIAPDHWYEGDAVIVDAAGAAEIIFRRMDPALGLVTETAVDVPCWAPPHPIAITAGPRRTAFVFEQDPRANTIGLLLTDDDQTPELDVLVPDTDAGLESRSLPNGNVGNFSFPTWLPWPIYPVPADVAAILATACHQP